MYTTDVASEDSEPDQRCERQTPDAPRFIVAHGRKGGWVFNDRLGLVGGIFITEAAARHFAIEESGHHAHAQKRMKVT